METLDSNIESRLKMCDIPFISLLYSDEKYPEKVRKMDFFGIIISGSKNSDPDLLPGVCDIILDSKVPKLGICYGAELLAEHLGAKIREQKESDKEYFPVIGKLYPSRLFEGIDVNSDVIVNMHHDYVFDCPKGCKIIASTDKTPVAGFEDTEKNIFGLQFHPEKGILGNLIFKNFFEICSNARIKD